MCICTVCTLLLCYSIIHVVIESVRTVLSLGLPFSFSILASLLLCILDTRSRVNLWLMVKGEFIAKALHWGPMALIGVLEIEEKYGADLLCIV